MRLSNQGQILDSKAGVGSVKLYVKKKLSFDSNSEIAVKNNGKFREGEKQKSENARAWFFGGLFAMQSICC